MELVLVNSDPQPKHLITDYYREQNRLLHEQRHDYGVNGHKHAAIIRELAGAMQTKDILDYGAGKCTLADALEGFQVRSYDPAFPQLAATPDPADLVVCGDVLEHIEPECLDAVLDDLVRVTRKLLFASVATRPAIKTLPDGRNTHLIQQSYQWWLPKIWQRFMVGSFHNLGGEFIVTCAPIQRKPIE